MLIDRRLLAHFDWPLFFLTFIILICGLIVLWSAGQDTLEYSQRLQLFGMSISSRAFMRQSLFAVVGSLLMLFAISIASRQIQRFSYLIYGSGLALLILVIFFGAVANGAKSWFVLGPIKIQPSEFAKIGMILALAKFITKNPPPVGGYHFTQLFLPSLIVLAPLCLIMLQPDLGSAMAFLAIGSLMLLFAGIRRITIISGLVIAMIAVPMGWPFLKQHQKLRVQVWLDPEKDPKGSGYHIIQSKIAVGSGGLLGKGFTQGSQSQLAFLPEHTTDFIFSVLAEEWGFIGSGAVLALYFLLLSRILRVSSRARDLWSALVVFGIASLIFFHLLINIGMVVGLLPVVGLPLPLFSYGGSSVVTILVGLGLVLGISMRRYALATRG